MSYFLCPISGTITSTKRLQHSIIKVRLLVKTLLMEIILGLKLVMDQVKTTKLYFGYFCRFVISALTLRPGKYVYLRFSSIVWFSQLLSHFLWVLGARSKLILFYTKFWVNRARFLASTCTSLLLHSKPVQWNYRDFFWDFKSKSAF